MDALDYRIEWLGEIESTNTYLREQLESANPPRAGTVCATSNQTAGRGRVGRTWLSGRGKNLCFSLFQSSKLAAVHIPALSMAVALAVDDMLLKLGIPSRPKWPNDVRVKGKKICGILSERIQRDSIRGAIVGIGMNVGMSLDEAREIDQPATSILIESGKAHSPHSVLKMLLPSLKHRISTWEGAGFSGIRGDWMERVEGLGEELEIHDGERVLEGLLQDFGRHGECLLRKSDGEIESVWSGDLFVG